MNNLRPDFESSDHSLLEYVLCLYVYLTSSTSYIPWKIKENLQNLMYNEQYIIFS